MVLLRSPLSSHPAAAQPFASDSALPLAAKDLTPDSLSPSASASQTNQQTFLPDSTITCEVAIVGSGIVGLTLATALKATGIRVMLLDSQPRDAGLQNCRAYAITLLSGKILAGLGVWSSILPRITTFKTIRLADATCPAVVDLRPDDLGTAELGYVAEHFVLTQALQESLTEMDRLVWWDCATVEQMDTQTNGATLLVRRNGQPHQVQAQLVVAADGARSPLRHQKGIKTDGWKYWQSCVTAIIRPERTHGNIAREHFWPSGPFATLPLPQNRCQIVLTAPHDEAQRYMAMTDTEFLAVLDQRYNHQLGHLELLTPRLLFPVQLMNSRCYVLPRLALVGDAAHCCHPVGGQGMNLGIRDAAVLAQVLMAAHQRKQDLGSLTTLKRYERWRWWENVAILAFTDLLDRIFSTRWWPIRWLRQMMLRLMQRLRWVKAIALWVMTGGLGRSPHIVVSEDCAQRTRNHPV